MSNARNVGRIRARTTRHRPVETHYLTAREAGLLANHERRKNEERGIFRRWNGRKLTPEQEQLAAEARKRAALQPSRKAQRLARRKPKPRPS